MSDKQVQKSGDGSVNIQTKSLQVGISYEDAKKIAQDVFESNFYRLTGKAKEIAKTRADELLEKYLDRLGRQVPEAIKSATDPDMQYALFTAQKEYARIGDKDLGDILVDILVDRASQQQRSLMQIVLNESLNVVPKLTQSQIDALTVTFILRYTQRLRLKDLAEFSSYVNNSILPFVDNLPKEPASYQHIEYCGCGIMQVTTLNLADAFRKTYSGLFDKGMTEQDVNSLVLTNSLVSKIIVPSKDDSTKFCFIEVYDEQLREIFKKIGFTEIQINQAIEARKQRLLRPEEVQKKIVSLIPKTENLFAIWKDSDLHRLTLTSVGIAIAHANIRRKVNETYDLSIWIK